MYPFFIHFSEYLKQIGVTLKKVEETNVFL